MKRLTLTVMLVAVALVCLGLASSRVGDDSQAAKPETHKGKTATFWYGRYAKEHRALAKHGRMVRKTQASLREVHRALVRLQRQPRYATAAYAIKLASSVFGVPFSEMWAVAGCETGHTYSPFARNRSSTASGLFQFLDSTWASQGIQGFSVFDPVANALGAARIVSGVSTLDPGERLVPQGWRQWVCRPG